MIDIGLLDTKPGTRGVEVCSEPCSRYRFGTYHQKGRRCESIPQTLPIATFDKLLIRYYL